MTITVQEALSEIYGEPADAYRASPEAIVAALRAAGYKIIAREPTDAMWDAYNNWDMSFGDAFRIMWDAAP